MTRPRMDVSVIVVTHNTGQLLPPCLESVRRWSAGYALEVIVVDNASRDDTAAVVALVDPDARLIVNPVNVGFARAVNQGLAAAQGRYALVLNSDARLMPGALAALVRVMEEQPNVGIAGAQLVSADGSLQRSFGAVPTLATELLNRSLLSRLRPARYPAGRLGGGDPQDVEAVIGACLLVRIAAVTRVGRLDERFFLFLEETDWCCRMRHAGWRVVSVPEARVVHLQGRTMALMPAAARIEYYRSRYLFFRKHRGPAAEALLRAGLVLRLVVVTVLHALVVAATVGRAERMMARWRTLLALLWWHVRLCPAHAGLRP